MLKVAVIGLGKMAMEDHLPAIQASDLYELVAVSDVVSSQVEKVSQQYSVPGFASVQQMVDEVKMDVAIICVPHACYLPVIKILASRGIHVVKEKPFATSLEEATELYKIIRENKVFLGVMAQRIHSITYL